VAPALWLNAREPNIDAEERMMPKNLSRQDQRFVMEVRPMNLAEIKMSQIAVDYASKPEIKEFAERMIQDHSKTNRDLMQIVRDSNVSPPDEPTPDQQKIVDRLWSLEGDEFDQEFVRAQVQDHERVVQLFEREAEQGQDEDLKQFAEDCLPIMQQHLQQVKTLAQSMRM
jgi:putative membrane protein